MPKLLVVAERPVRLMAGITAGILLLIVLSMNAGWISRGATYHLQTWYLVEQSGNFVITKEYEDESACRKGQQDGKQCRSGAQMMASVDQSKASPSVH